MTEAASHGSSLDSTGSAPTSSPRTSSSLVRVNILDASGVCLCDKVWEWSRPSSPSDISKLVLSFYQISSQMGHAEGPKEVLFTEPKEYSRRNPKRGARRVNKVKDYSSGSGIMRLVTVRVEGGIILGAFHKAQALSSPLDDLFREKLENFLASIGAKFVKTFEKQLEDLRSKAVFKDIIEERGKQPLKPDDILAKFKQFEELISKKGNHLREAGSTGSSDQITDVVPVAVSEGSTL